MLGGCAGFERVAAAPETFVVCRAVDTVSTLVIVHRGGTELNPLMRAALHSTPVFLAAQVALTVAVWQYWPAMTNTGRAAVNLLGCVPALHNVGQL